MRVYELLLRKMTRFCPLAYSFADLPKPVELSAVSGVAVGFDLVSDPTRRIAIETTISIGRATASAPIRLVQADAVHCHRRRAAHGSQMGKPKWHGVNRDTLPQRCVRSPMGDLE